MKAFPHTFGITQEDGRTGNVTQFGMDLRDHFAGLAMKFAFEVLHNPELDDEVNFEGDDGFFHSDLSVVAMYAYYLADAMMEARKK